ncbi:MAG: hypothetical protein ACQETB_09655 [Halobacteriota archaeon]
MDRNRFVFLALVAFGLILASFLIRGTARLLFSYTVALTLTIPVVLAAVLILSYLFAWGVLDVTGVRSIE